MIWLLALLACETVEVCTEESHPSVTVSVVDYQGAPIQQAQVFYSVDGSEEVEAILFDDESWVTTFEEPGMFRVRAQLEASYSSSYERDSGDCDIQTQQTKEVVIDMAENSCHVDGQHLTFRFTPEDANCID